MSLTLKLTPKPKVCKVLKKVKKKRSYELKCTTTTTKTKVAKAWAEPKTFGTADLKCIHYATTPLPLEWQTQHFIWTASCEVYL